MKERGNPTPSAVVDWFLSVLCPSAFREASRGGICDYAPGTCFLSVGLCLPRDIWAEVGNLKGGVAQTRVTMRRQEQCAAGLAAQKAAGSDEDAEWGNEVRYSHKNGGSYAAVWEDYACAMQQSSAREFISMAFTVRDGPGWDTCRASVRPYQRVFTLTLGASSLSPEMVESLQQLGHALAPALAPHLPEVLASLDLFLLPGLFDIPRGAVSVEAPPTARPSSSPDTNPSPLLSESDHNSDQPTLAAPFHQTEAGPVLPDANCPKMPAALVPLQGSMAAVGIMDTPAGSACPCACSQVAGDTHLEGCLDEGSWSLLVASRPDATTSQEESIMVLASGRKQSGACMASDPTVSRRFSTALGSHEPGEAGTSCSTPGDVGAEKASKMVAVELTEPSGAALQRVDEREGHAQGRPGVDVTRDALWLTFQDPAVEQAFQRSIGKKRLRMDFLLLLFLTLMWYATKVSLPMLEGTVSLRHFWQHFTILLYGSVFAAMLFRPSWYCRHREWIVSLIKFMTYFAGTTYVWQVKADQPQELPNTISRHGRIIPAIYFMEGIFMPVSLQWALPFEATAMALASESIYQGCAFGCSIGDHSLSPLACRALFTIYSALVSNLIPVSIAWWIEKGERARFAVSLAFN